MIRIAAYYNINNLENWLEGKKILELDRKPMLRL